MKIFDCDNHYYEALDAFTRHVPANMHHRCVQIAEVDGRTRHVVGGVVDYSVGNPLFDPIAKPGVLYDYFKGNPSGKPASELMRGDLEPQPAAYRDPDARLKIMDEQGVESVWLFPTLGVLYEERLKHDPEAVCATFQGFNRWLDEDWGLCHNGRIFSAPYISLADVDWACRELEWALGRDARVLVMRPAAVCTANGPRSPADTHFDPFWARVNEAGITVIAHTGNSGYSNNGYAPDDFGRSSLGMGRRPSVKSLCLERAANDFLLTLAFDKLFERFPNLRVGSIENGSGFLPDLFRQLESAKARNPWHFAEDPIQSFRKHVWINPFWEDEIEDVVELMGAENVIFGSDWPHMEGLADPKDILSEIGGLDEDSRNGFLYDNTRGLNERRPA
jgi:predicted TIM-barrel fold metal-dependent hydrolase